VKTILFTRGNAVEIFKLKKSRKGEPRKLRIQRFLTNNIWQLIVSNVVFQEVVFCGHINRM